MMSISNVLNELEKGYVKYLHDFDPPRIDTAANRIVFYGAALEVVRGDPSDDIFIQYFVEFYLINAIKHNQLKIHLN